MRKTLTLIILAILSGIGALAEPTEQQRAEIDSLTYHAASCYNSPECLQTANIIHVKAVQTGYWRRADSAINLKAGYYFNHEMFDELQTLFDSIRAEPNFSTEHLETYAYVLESVCSRHTQMFHFRSAILLAEELFAMSEPAPTDDAETATHKAYAQAQALNILAETHYSSRRYDEATRYNDKLMEWSLKHPDNIESRMEASLRKCLIAEVNGDTKQKEDALRTMEESLKFMKENSPYEPYDDAYKTYSVLLRVRIAIDKNDNATARQEIAQLQNRMDEEDEASKDIVLHDIYYLCQCIYNNHIGNYANALEFAQKLQISSEESNTTMMTHLAKMQLCHAAIGLKETELAQKTLKEIDDLNDSISAQESRGAIEDLSMILGNKELQRETERLEAQKQKLAMSMLIVILISVVVVILIVTHLNRKREHERQRLLSEQNDKLEAEVARQTQELRIKNQEITDSINYACRIQKAILPNITKFTDYGVEGAFAYFKPLNIVSGDFYWSRNGDKLLFVCADCTGHGVPGAFMSMIGSAILNEICSREVLPQPSKILSQLDEQVIELLKQNGNNDVHDGMDLTLASYDPTSKTLEITSARRPFFLILDGALTEVKGTKRSIGDHDELSRQEEFVTHTYQVKQGDTLYVCSDGIIDQFGGQDSDHPRGKRLKSSGFRKFLMELCNHPIEQQEAIVDNFYTQWRGTCEQIDDISVMGIRF